MIQPDFSGISLQLKRENDKVNVFDIVRRKWVTLTPEEHVRQYLLQYLTEMLGYPAGMIAVEKKIKVGPMDKRFDLVVYDRQHRPWMLVECKAPEQVISERTLHQLLNYHRAVPCRYWVLSNGPQLYCADAADPQHIVWLDRLPAYNL
jgi:hypothetical protein